MLTPQQVLKIKHEQRRLRYLCVARTAVIRTLHRCLRSSSTSVGLTNQEAQQQLQAQARLRTLHLRKLSLLSARLFPISELPLEVLQHIFALLAQGQPGREERLRVVLMRVSRGWREAVLGTPELWQSVVLDYSSGNHQELGITHGRRRTGDASAFPPFEPRPHPPEQSVPASRPFTNPHLLKPFRFTVLSLTIHSTPPAAFLASLSSLSPGSLPTLKVLILLADERAGPGQERWVEALYTAAPGLRQLSIRGLYPLPLNLGTLRSLSLSRGQLTADDLSTIAELHSLHRLSLSAQDFPSPPLHPIRLHDLQCLTILLPPSSPHLPALLEALHTPSLKHLHYILPLPSRPTWGRPISAWQALAEQPWELQTLHLGMGGDSEEWAAQLGVLQALGGGLRTLVLKWMTIQRLMLAPLPALPALQELVILDFGAHSIVSSLVLLRFLNLLQPTSSKLKSLRVLSSVREKYKERKRYGSGELRGWREVGKRAEVWWSWDGGPFGGLEEGEEGEEGDRALSEGPGAAVWR
ncbi:hypothetical protein CALCODRAFT_321159 [Calocera cornea HHB12733]|uniref:F-box domain-containing protein n=1 Tax=Calocera cornea HHB12733 TaxID=1353952 RepID=A0A165F652_9BASI|nr:hypothetical protein CALCODRAFT_321159 [Calocera cornea HHB12733]